MTVPPSAPVRPVRPGRTWTARPDRTSDDLVTRTVVVEFDSVEAARARYESDAHQAARPVRQAASTCNVVIVSGFELPKG